MAFGRSRWLRCVRSCGWLGGAGLRTVAGQAGVDRKTARCYVTAAEAAGVVHKGGLAQLTDEVIGQVLAAGRAAGTTRRSRPSLGGTGGGARADHRVGR